MTDVGTAAPAFFGYAGAALGLVFANCGAAYGTAKVGTGLAAIGPMFPEQVMRNIIPVVMAGVMGIYGLIVAVIVSGQVTQASDGISTFGWPDGFKLFAAGLCVGLSGTAAGYATGDVGEAGVRAVAKNPILFVGMMLVLIFAGACALFGLIVGLIIATG